MFQLHQRLAQDTVKVGEFLLCEVLMMNDSHYPWIILVPKRDAITEIHDLDHADQQQLMCESSYVAKLMKQHYAAKKMNVAALGNMVSQLHIHHIARFEQDAAWPKPVWGVVSAEKYNEEKLHALVKQYQQLFTEMLKA